MRHGLLGVVVIAALALGSGNSNAASVTDVMAQHRLFQLEDDSAEFAEFGGGDGTLDLGDTLSGIASFPVLRDLATSTDIDLDGVANNTLTAIFGLEVTGKTANGANWDFTFGPSAAWLAARVGLSLSAGTVLAFYEDPVDNFNIGGATCTTPGAGMDCEGNVTDGTLVLELGFGADLDSVWQAIDASDSLASGAAFGVADNLGDFQFQLEVLTSLLGAFNQIPTNPIIPAQVGGDGLIDWRGSGQILGINDVFNNATTPFQFTDDADLVAFKIPEPATLAIFGFGLLALGFAVRRRQKVAA